MLHLHQDYKFVISGNLFTRDYLLDGIERTAQWKGLTDEDSAIECGSACSALATKLSQDRQAQ